MNKKRGKLHNSEKVISDIIKLLYKTHDIKQKVEWYNDYKGEDTGHHLIGTDSVPIAEAINEETWEFNHHGNGSPRTILNVILWGVYTMGMEQAAIKWDKKNQPELEMLRKNVGLFIEQLKKNKTPIEI